VKPNLTLTRWAALKALKASVALRRRPFLARELIYAGGRRGRMIAATGPTMESLRGAGWIEAVPVCKPGEAMPFRSSGPMMPVMQRLRPVPTHSRTARYVMGTPHDPPPSHSL
jgi:hypothetical protein